MIRLAITAILGAAATATAYAAGTHGMGFESLLHTTMPDPVSLVLIGSCLMGLGLIGRQRGTAE